jgi:hypothetical protein
MTGDDGEVGVPEIVMVVPVTATFRPAIVVALAKRLMEPVPPLTVTV